jgi:hypothetical protein
MHFRQAIIKPRSLYDHKQKGRLKGCLEALLKGHFINKINDTVQNNVLYIDAESTF